MKSFPGFSLQSSGPNRDLAAATLKTKN